MVAALAVLSRIQTFSLNIIRNPQADGDINNFEADKGNNTGPQQGNNHTPDLRHYLSTHASVSPGAGDVINNACAA